MPGVLLDTHALVWLMTIPDQLTDEALIAVAESQQIGSLYVSPITAWELSVATQKPARRGRPDLKGQEPGAWFRQAVRFLGARLVPVHQRIALEAADVAVVYGRKDPGDCFLIATARVRGVPTVTRDGQMCELAHRQPDYLPVIVC